MIIDSFVHHVFCTGGKQILSLDYGCVNVGVIIHEFLHIIGFFHEQSRPDRDDFITVVYENIVPGFEGKW